MSVHPEPEHLEPDIKSPTASPQYEPSVPPQLPTLMQPLPPIQPQSPRQQLIEREQSNPRMQHITPPTVQPIAPYQPTQPIAPYQPMQPIAPYQPMPPTPIPQAYMPQAPLPQVIPHQQNTTNVVVVNQQPATEDRLVLGSVYGHREWTTGLFGCTEDICGCIQTCCCAGCVIRTIAVKLNESICVAECVPGSLVALRTRLRTLGGIKGSICTDYCVLYWFGSCAICQMMREIENMQL